MNICQTKQQAMDLFEEKRMEVLSYSRWVAERICKEKGHVCIDDIRAIVNLPENINPKVFGAVFQDDKKWVRSGYKPTSRPEAHGRLVGVYTLSNNYIPEKSDPVQMAIE